MTSDERVRFIDDLAKVMVERGLTRVQSGEILLERPAALATAEGAAKLAPDKPDDADPGAEADDLAKFKAMTPDAQDAALARAMAGAP